MAPNQSLMRTPGLRLFPRPDGPTNRNCRNGCRAHFEASKPSMQRTSPSALLMKLSA